MKVSKKKVIRNKDGTWNIEGKISQTCKVISQGDDYEINVFDMDEGKKLAVSYTKPTRSVGTPFEFEKEK